VMTSTMPTFICLLTIFWVEQNPLAPPCHRVRKCLLTSWLHLPSGTETAQLPSYTRAKLRVEQEGRYIGGGVPYGYRLEKRGRHNYLIEVPEQQDIIRYVDTSMIRFKKMGKKAPWRRLSNQIGSLYNEDMPPWKVQRIAERRLKERATV
jgi:hypothetical protein